MSHSDYEDWEKDRKSMACFFKWVFRLLVPIFIIGMLVRIWMEVLSQ